MTNNGKRALRQFLIESIDEMSVGTGGSDPRESDDELDEEIFRDDVSNEAVDIGRMLSRVKLGVADANNTQIRELMMHIDDESFAQVVFANTEKTENIELAFEAEVEAINTD